MSAATSSTASTITRDSREGGQRVGCGLAPAPHRPECTPAAGGGRRRGSLSASARRGVASDATWHPSRPPNGGAAPERRPRPPSPASTRSSCSIGADGCCQHSCWSLLDLTGVTLALYAALVLRNAYRGEKVLFGLPWAAISNWLQFIALVLVLVFARAGLYRQRETQAGRRAVIRSLALVTLHLGVLCRRGRGHDIPQLLRHLLGHVRFCGGADLVAARELRQHHARADAAARHPPAHAARRSVGGLSDLERALRSAGRGPDIELVGLATEDGGGEAMEDPHLGTIGRPDQLVAVYRPDDLVMAGFSSPRPSCSSWSSAAASTAPACGSCRRRPSSCSSGPPSSRARPCRCSRCARRS